MSIKRVLSWGLILGGVLVVVQGAREVVDSWLGQREAAAEWRPSATPPGRSIPDLGPAVARLSIPRLGAEWFVFEGVGKKSLRLGPGHVEGTALPGTLGNCVIAGHRDTHFRVLKDVQEGDEILTETRQGYFRYRVTKVSVVSPKNTQALLPSQDAVLNLITCYPFYYLGPAPKRFIVKAEFDPGIRKEQRPS